MASGEQFLKMGSIGRAHGIRGETGINWLGDNPVQENSIVYVAGDDSQEPRPYRVLTARMHKGRPLVRLEGVEGRSGAESLLGRDIYVRRQSLPPLAEDEAYLCDLLGCDVLLPDGGRLGSLDHVEFPAGREVWSIKTDAGREVLFPAQPGFIESFDLEARRIVIDPPPGLLEIYSA